MKKIIIELEINKIVKKIDSGILLNDNIIKKNLYSDSRKLIENLFKNKEREFSLFILDLLFKNPHHYLNFNALLNDYFYFYPESPTHISTGKKNKEHGDETSGSSGGSHHHPSENVDRELEDTDFKKLSDIPIYQISDLISKRKDDFGIWISKEALRHFESLTCCLDIAGPIFRKIENHFNANYSNNGWFTAINNEKKKKLGLSFGFQFHKNGHIRVHLSGPNKDIEQFIQHFFEVFKKFLSDEEIIEFLEALVLERSKKPVFKIHEARRIGPKKIVDEEFKGAHIRVNEVHWFGKIRWDARIDYSKPLAPHIEAEGPMPQVGNFMRLIDGTPEFIANLSEIRELSYRNRDISHEIFRGVGELSEISTNNGQSLLLIKDNIDKLDLKNDIYQVELREILNNINKKFPKLKETLIELNTESSIERAKIRDVIKDLLTNNVQLITQILNLDTNIQGNIEDAKKVIERAFLDTTTIINEAKDEIIEKVELVGQKVDSLKSFISEEFKDSRNQIRFNIYLILKKMEKVPEITAKKLAEELSVSKKTIYSYLKRLQDKNLILAEVKKRNRKGRPAKIFRLNLGKLYKIIKKGDD